jgi:hypothetical protein
MPTLATTSRAQLGYIPEATFGTTPGSGNGRKLRMTGESLNYDLSKEESKELRDDRQVASATTVDANAAGGFNFHMQYGEYDQLIEGALQGTWDAFGTNGVGATFTATIDATTITASGATSGSSIFTALDKGQWFRLVAPSDDNDGLYFRVSTTTAPTTTVITLDASTPGVASVGVANCQVQTSRLMNGTTQPSFTLERQMADVTQFFTFRGMTVSKMSLNFNSAALTDGSFDFMGKDAIRAGATALPGSIVASRTYDIQNGVRGVGHMWMGGSPITTTFIKSMTLNVDNSLRARKALANMGSVSIGSGDFKVTGSLEVYFADGTEYDAFLGDTYTSLIVSTKDTEGNGYVFSLPRVLLMSGKIMAGGKNQDIMASFDFSAFSDDDNAVSGLRKTLIIDRVGDAITFA